MSPLRNQIDLPDHGLQGGALPDQFAERRNANHFLARILVLQLQPFV